MCVQFAVQIRVDSQFSGGHFGTRMSSDRFAGHYVGTRMSSDRFAKGIDAQIACCYVSLPLSLLSLSLSESLSL